MRMSTHPADEPFFRLAHNCKQARNAKTHPWTHDGHIMVGKAPQPNERDKIVMIERMMRFFLSKSPGCHARPICSINRHCTARAQHSICFPHFGTIVTEEVHHISCKDLVDRSRRPREMIKPPLFQPHATNCDCPPVIPGGLREHRGRMVDSEHTPRCHQLRQLCNSSARPEAQLQNDFARSDGQRVDCKANGLAIRNRQSTTHRQPTKPRWMRELPSYRTPHALESAQRLPKIEVFKARLT